MSARLRAINNHLPQLEIEIEQLVTTISKECNTKGIIKQEIYISLIKSSKSRKEKAKSLIYHVWQTIRRNDKQCETFIQILEKHRSCQDVTRKIRQDIQDIEDSSVIAQAKDGSNGIMSLSPLQPHHRNRHCQLHTTSIPCTESSPSPCIPKLRNRLTTSNSDNIYNVKMEKAQEEAKLMSATEERDKLMAERDVLKNQHQEARRERLELERKLHHKDKELEEITTERKNLLEYNEILKLKISQAEKKKYMDKKKLKQLISEYDEDILKLEKEKEVIETAFEEVDIKYKLLKQRMDLLEGVSRQYEAIVTQLKEKLEMLEQNSQNKNPWCLCLSVTALITICLCLLVICAIVFII